jgi:deoxyribodipyrimidine photo-lyase
MVNSAIWFRRDLRLDDNTALNAAIKSGNKILPVFIFDDHILNGLNREDHRVEFILNQLRKMNAELLKVHGRICIRKGDPVEVWQRLISEFDLGEIYTNRDYEPYALERDSKVKQLIENTGGSFFDFKDHVIMEPGDVLKDNGEPYTIYTPFKNKWLNKFTGVVIENIPLTPAFIQHSDEFPDLEALDFRPSQIRIPDFNLTDLESYAKTRDIPFLDSTTRVGSHLRFGTISIRKLIEMSRSRSETFLSELIWREFFIQILYYFPKVVHSSFRPQYDNIPWLNNENDFQKWCEGKTGFPMVDAGMRELNATGHMHNRVRMLTASFLCKHLLIDWRWGEAYFAEKLNDYELASNNGNWQWAAGTGCDAAPYFRVFSPSEQLRKFDPKMEYIKKWIPELLSGNYSQPMIDHAFARNRAIATYKKGLSE